MLWITIMNKIHFWIMRFLLTSCSLNSEHRSFCFQFRAAPILEICNVWFTVYHMCRVALSVFITTSVTFTYTVTNVAGGSHTYCYQTWKMKVQFLKDFLKEYCLYQYNGEDNSPQIVEKNGVTEQSGGEKQAVCLINLWENRENQLKFSWDRAVFG